MSFGSWLKFTKNSVCSCNHTFSFLIYVSTRFDSISADLLKFKTDGGAGFRSEMQAYDLETDIHTKINSLLTST